MTVHLVTLKTLTFHRFEFRVIKNEFTLTLPTDIDMVEVGQYEYSIYEQTSAVNIDPDLADNELEIGKMLLKETATTITETTENFYTP